jgi:hypothetical protein
LIERLIWPQPIRDNTPRPFHRGNSERPLRITIHSSSFIGASSEDIEAINVLRDLSKFPEIQAVDTEAGALPHLQIGTGNFKVGHQEIPVTIVDRDRRQMFSITQADYWVQVAAEFARQTDPQHPDAQAAFKDLLVARAHNHRRHDILVTLSRPLLDNKTRPNMRTINMRTPTEAVKIVGLFARSRGNYALDPHVQFDRGLFYFVLARHRLPSMWRYFSACVDAETIRQDATLDLGESILVRAVRALEARDAIGEQFYLPQDNSTRDTIMYHFDYLTLLLVGVFDAEARIAHRAYGITRPVERWASFHQKNYLKALRDNGATNLYGIVSKQDFKDLTTLLHQLRNTIHGAALRTMGSSHSYARPAVSYVIVLPDYRQALWQAATRYSSPDHWGLVQQGSELWLEPYTYAVTLVDECFKYIDAIAAATDVEKLFPSGHTIPPLLDQPPENELPFSERTRHRIAILG